MKRVFMTALILSLGFAITGCSRGPEMGVVHGKVTLNGEPVPFAYVHFQPTSPPGTYSASYANEAGEYKLIYTKDLKGAPVGKYEVTVRTANKEELQVEDKTTGKLVTPTLPKGYKANLEANFEREVAKGDNSLDFEIARK